MVTKRRADLVDQEGGLILAKIHMVTKHIIINDYDCLSLILAKIHMVTKRTGAVITAVTSLILAKIHMVTKLFQQYQIKK